MTNTATVTVLRPTGEDKDPLFLTVVVDRNIDEVVDALDEWGSAIALTPDEERFALRIVAMNLDETGS